MNKIIYNIQSDFIKEAKSSPILLSDLANMEKYISESYSGRSLIELLQNADDAGATKFTIKKLSNNIFIAANNGKEFDENDLNSLCRSGNSTKQRKANTIGFRGIGFKSVVNYAKQVHLISGDYKVSFSKELTQIMLNSKINVPLIRIPHIFESKEYDSVINQIKTEGYKTIFIFETQNNTIETEIQDFNASCMLFLHNITEILFDFNNLRKILSHREIRDNNSYFVNLESNKEQAKWLVFNDKETAIAFRYDNECCIPCEENEAVIHSFMPTKDRISAFFKINGDFSTDPSRTHIVNDDETNDTIVNVAKLLTQIFVSIYKTGKDDLKIINILKTLKVNPLARISGETINDLLVKAIKQNIQKQFSQDKPIYLQPLYINDGEFRSIINELNFCGICNIKGISNLNDFMKNLGFEYLTMEQYLPAIQKIKCCLETRIGMLCEIINKTRFELNEQIKNEISKCNLIEFESGTKPLNQISSADSIKKSFSEAVINELNSVVDYNNFLRKFGVDDSLLVKSQVIKTNIIEQLDTHSFSKTNIFQKWRSVEKNVACVLETVKGVKEVLDVSEQNAGYDLEIIKDDGSHEFCEVKSVSGLGDSFSLTNNEYTTAITHKEKYMLAITYQTNNKISICLIKDPLSKLDFIKRATKWEWICDTYTGKLLECPIE